MQQSFLAQILHPFPGFRVLRRDTMWNRGQEK